MPPAAGNASPTGYATQRQTGGGPIGTPCPAKRSDTFPSRNSNERQPLHFVAMTRMFSGKTESRRGHWSPREPL